MLVDIQSRGSPRLSASVWRSSHEEMRAIRIEWSEEEPAVDVSTPEEVDTWLERIAAGSSVDQPTIVTLHVHDHRLLLGLGLPESFVQLERESGDPPYIATVGDPNADDVVAFYLHGVHHTEIPRRYLVEAATAREVVREFTARGTRSTAVVWEEI